MMRINWTAVFIVHSLQFNTVRRVNRINPTVGVYNYPGIPCGKTVTWRLDTAESMIMMNWWNLLFHQPLCLSYWSWKETNGTFRKMVRSMFLCVFFKLIQQLYSKLAFSGRVGMLLTMPWINSAFADIGLLLLDLQDSGCALALK